MVELGLDLNITKDTLVVAIEYTSDGREESETKAFRIVHQTSPPDLVATGKNGFEAASWCCTASHNGISMLDVVRGCDKRLMWGKNGAPLGSITVRFIYLDMPLVTIRGNIQADPVCCN